MGHATNFCNALVEAGLVAGEVVAGQSAAPMIGRLLAWSPARLGKVYCPDITHKEFDFMIRAQPNSGGRRGRYVYLIVEFQDEMIGISSA
jgi:hypothetical protein